ncbi:MAG: hypothetical protein K9N06_13075 [Candidatus Cloacimonetes bacterium]|nr:hypothetical protein [Candidatus Cloacimonadota bacterium]
MLKLDIRQFLITFIVLIALTVISYYNYLLFHTLAEFFCILILFSVFLFTRNTQQYMKNNYLIFIGISFIFIGFFDLLHTFTYGGLSILTTYDLNLPTQLWIVARLLQAIAFLIAPFFITRRLNLRLVLICAHLLTLLLIASIFIWHIFPECFVEGSGLTLFKIISEYFISFLLVLSIFNLVRFREFFDKQILSLLVFSIIFTILSELSFTFYINVYGILNLIGHLFKIIAFVLIYKAILVAGVKNPFQLLFRDLKKTQDELLENQRSLEIKVQEAVAEVEEKNKMLLLQSRQAQLGEMISGITHQWKQPLNHISILTSALMDAWVYDEFSEELLKTKVDSILIQIKEMNTILNDFISFYSPQSDVGVFLLNEILVPIEELAGNSLAHADIKLNTAIPEEMKITGKMNELLQVFLVIINNSRDAFSDKDNAGREIMIKAFENEKEQQIIISDNAGGIAQEVLPQIFNPYYTTKGDKGTGTGLYLARIIIEKHFNGNISAHNTDRGAEFIINLRKENSELI